MVHGGRDHQAGLVEPLRENLLLGGRETGRCPTNQSWEYLRHAVANSVFAGDLDDGSPLRVLYLGPDRAGNLLEVVVIERDDGSELAIHAMKMRQQYEELLPVEMRDG